LVRRGHGIISPVTTTAIDQEVIERARSGAPGAWELIYDSLSPAVLGYLRMRGAADPEDLLSECFLQLVRDIRSFEGDARDLRSWTFTVAHNRLLDDVRKRVRRPLEPVPLEALDAAMPAGDTEREALSSMSIGHIERAVGRLTPDQGEVLALRLFGQLTVEETARIVGKRAGAVKALQRRGLAALRREISTEGVTL
jgi:RNA polymerase sigma-70 factor (ECF subfamily)